MKQIHDVKKSKGVVEEYATGDQKIQELKAELNEMRDQLRLEIKSISEMDSALSKVKLANKLGCTTEELTTIEVDCPASKMGKVIGKNGSTVKQIEEKSKVTITIRKDDSKIAVTGSSSSVAEAVADIEKIAQSIEEHFSLDSQVLKYLTSRNISVLSDLQNEFDDLYMDVPRNSQNATLRGMPERVSLAKLRLLGIKVVTHEKSLTRREAAILIGEKGATVDKLLESHAVCIDVKKVDHENSTATILGRNQDVTSVLTEIDELLSENEEATEILPVTVMMKRILLDNNGAHVKALQKSVNEKMKERGVDSTVHVSFSFDKEKLSKEPPSLQIKTRKVSAKTAVQITRDEIKAFDSLMTSVDVDPLVIPKIIGKGGETLKEITSDNAWVDVDKASNKVLVGSSSSSETDKVVREIMAIITANQVLRIDYDASSMKAQVRELSRSKAKTQITEIGCWLSSDEERSQFILRGSTENNEKAKNVLMEFLETNYLREMSLTQEEIDALLSGGKESKLEKISEEDGVRLSVDRKHSLLFARGAKEKVDEVIKKIDLFLNGGNGRSVARFSITDQVVGVVVGKGGKTRQDLEKKFDGVDIYISKKSHTVSIRGPVEQVAACKVEVLKLISSARVSQSVEVTDMQQKDLKKNEVLRKISRSIPTQIQISGATVQIKGMSQDVRDAVSLLNEHLTGVYSSSIELDPSQLSKVRTATRDPSHFQRIIDATHAKVSLDPTSGSVIICGKRADVKRAKDQVFGFFEFILPGEIVRLHLSKPLFSSVGRAVSLAEISAESGGTVMYLDRDLGSIVIRSPDPEKADKASNLMKKKIAEGEKLAFVIEVEPSEASWIFAYVIGPKGSRIKNIQKESDCTIEVSKESHTITVVGKSQERVAQAKATISDLITKARNENVFVSMSESAIPVFCGKGGTRMKEFSATHGVDIQRQRRGPYAFRITGPEESCAKAKEAVKDWLEEWEESTGSVIIPIEKQFIPIILGSNGETAKAIEKEFGCRIDIDRKALSLTVKNGKEESRLQTLEKIQAMIEEARATAAAARKAKSEYEESSDTIDEPRSSVGYPHSRSGDSGSGEEVSTATNTKAFPTRPVGLTTPPKKVHLSKTKVNDPHAQEGTQAGRNLFQLLVTE